MSASPSRPLRRDAAQNRARLLDAASTLFAERGPEAGVDQVARAAGVGMGTLYRRFASKQALVDELVGGARLDLLAIAKGCRAMPDGGGLERLIVEVGQLQADRGACLARIWDYSDAEPEAVREFRAILRSLLRRAHAAGRVRADVTTTDVTMALWSLRAVVAATREVAPQAWRRHVHLLMAGLRPGPGDAPFPTPAMTEAQAQTATHSRRDSE